MKIKNGSRGDDFSLMLVNIILGVILVVMAFMAFLNPEENMVLFPLIFFAAAAMRFSNAVYGFLTTNHEKKWKSGGIRDMILGIIILVIGIVSAVGVWS